MGFLEAWMQDEDGILNPKRGARPREVDVIMPVLNERHTVVQAVSQVLSVQLTGFRFTLTIVESGSTDGTRELLRPFQGHERIRILYQDTPRGKGNAVRKALRETNGDIILIQDADLEYSVNDYGILLGEITEGKTDFVIGVRSQPAKTMRYFADQPKLSHLMNYGHIIFRALFNFTFRASLVDPFSMYKVFRRDCIKGMRFRANRFDFDWELAGKLLLRGYEPVEIPVKYESRSFLQGKKVNLFKDPVTWILICLRCRLLTRDWKIYEGN